MISDHPSNDPCAAVRSVTFTPEAAAAVGVAVHLVPMAGEIWVVAGTDRVGRIVAAEAPELTVCIRGGWAFDGVIERIRDSQAVAVVRGHPTR